MSDHLDAPGPVVLTAPDAEPGPNEFADALFPDKNGLDSVSIGPPHGLAHLATDITDVYAFQKPDAGDGEDDSEDGEVPGKSILILNVNPLALATKFETDAEYLIRVDTDGDHHEDITFSFTFSDSEDGGQTANVRRIAGGEEEDDDSVLFHHTRVSLGKEAHISSRDGYRFFAGLRSDPFFFDLIGFIDDLNFVNGDFFAKLNVYSIVLEVPNRALGNRPHTTSLWGRTRIKDTNGQMINDDNAARAAINTVFNHGQDKNIFSSLEPSQQPTALNSEGITFVQSFMNTLSALGGNTALANVLLPDVLNYDYTKPTSYGALNGRHLADDVISISLSLVTNGGLTTENVPPHTDYLAHFPYVGNPH